MKNTGIVRKLDQLGRLTIPKELRKFNEIKEGDPLEFFTEDDRIIIRKYNPSDIFSGECSDLVEYNGVRVSKTSIQELIQIAGFSISE